jgi:hypothetical protein
MVSTALSCFGTVWEGALAAQEPLLKVSRRAIAC